jgi:hypothetical protein
MKETTFKKYRVHSEIVYRNPRWDILGFPENEPIYNPDPTIEIHNEELEELVMTITAQEEQEVQEKIQLLLKVNRHILDILTDCPGCSIIEL